MTTRAELIAEARKWIGTPFRHTGRNALGLDCAGLIVVSARPLGLIAADFDVKGYERNAAGYAFVEAFRAAGMIEVLPITDMREGDALVLVETNFPCHCALLSSRHGKPYMIHAYAPKRRTWEDPYAFDWPSRLRHVFRFPGLVD